MLFWTVKYATRIIIREANLEIKPSFSSSHHVAKPGKPQNKKKFKIGPQV
jgi:hypothetical protein